MQSNWIFLKLANTHTHTGPVHVPSAPWFKFQQSKLQKCENSSKRLWNPVFSAIRQALPAHIHNILHTYGVEWVGNRSNLHLRFPTTFCRIWFGVCIKNRRISSILKKKKRFYSWCKLEYKPLPNLFAWMRWKKIITHLNKLINIPKKVKTKKKLIKWEKKILKLTID